MQVIFYERVHKRVDKKDKKMYSIYEHVHLNEKGDDTVRKKDDSLRGALIDYARELAEKEGPEAVNIRSLAGKAGIATGTVYNYFSCKDEILLALTEEYWRKTLADMRAAVTAPSFCGQLEEIFTFLRERIDSSAGMLMHSLGNVRETGQERMESMQEVLEAAMVYRMEQDPGIRSDIWDETFTKSDYARFIMANMMLLLREHPYDFRFFLEIVKRTIY